MSREIRRYSALTDVAASVPTDKDTRAKALALAALCEGCSLTKAAEKAGVPPKVLHKWLETDVPFQREIARMLRMAIDTAQRKLVSGAAQAANTVLEIAMLPDGCDAKVAAVRLKAAEAALDRIGLHKGNTTHIELRGAQGERVTIDVEAIRSRLEASNEQEQEGGDSGER